MIERIRRIFAWYERYVSPVAFLAGFALDSFTLTRADLLLDNLVLMTHLLIAAIGIVLTNAYDSGRIRPRRLARAGWLFPLIIQFSFGALFSGFTVLYVRSGSLAASWLFIAILAVLLVGNEFFRHRYRRLAFHLTIYFVALYAYLILAIPVAIDRIGAAMFMASGVLALAFFALFAAGVAILVPRTFRDNRRPLAMSIGIVFVLFNLFYFTNIIPPIPLALKRLGVYHAVLKADGGYRVRYEAAPSYAFFRESARTFHWHAGEPVYAASAVFAPTGITAAVFHRWLRLDAETGAWIETDRMAFAIAGGRDGGWRGYSQKYGVSPGRWRVEVRTERGQLLGRTSFEIVAASESPELTEGEF